jgi:hypothetical protein
MLVEVLLQLFVGIVDAELLETVHHKVLESEDVQHADERRPALRLTRNRLVDAIDEVVE